ncbi:MAG: hypothetical protein JSW71_09380, partial [Gemmatimonadota bacterium]
MHSIILPFLGIIALLVTACQGPSTRITSLRVQSSVEPLAIEDENPLFSWQMVSNTTGQKQTAYQILVTRESDGEVVWDSDRVESGLSNNIPYAGDPLEPETAYSWALVVWDANGQTYTEASWFETGLMNPDISAWDGARFIGTNALTLDATSACLFEINTDFQILEGDAVSVVFGADDFRFNDSFQNIEDVVGENYVRFELDVSGAGTETGTVLNIYRVGYGKDDSADEPYKVISAALYPETNINDIITEENRHDVHNLSIVVDASDITLQLDGVTVQTEPPPAPGGGPPSFFRRPASSIAISNYDTGNNFNTYPNLNSVGFASRPGGEAVFTHYRILNKGRSNPDNNVVFDANAGATYSIFEGLEGVTVSADGTSITVR